MKRIFSLLLLLVSVSASAQQQSSYWVTFTDKNNSPYSLDQPQKFLTEASLKRRARQNISLNSGDLPVSPAYLDDLKSNGFRIHGTSRWFNAALVIGPANSETILSSFPHVATVRFLPPVIPSSSDTKFNESFSPAPASADRAVIGSDYGLSRDQAEMIHVTCLHDMGFRGQGVNIAVIDAGFLNANTLPVFDSLRNENRLLGCRDFATGDTMVFEDASHGMMVLSCMAGNLPGRLVGTAPKANYWLLRTEVTPGESIIEEYFWALGAEFADSVGADVINSSLGYQAFDDSSQNHTFPDMDGNTTLVTKAADLAAARGIVVVNSAGNSGGWPWYKITAPADADSILTVGAVDSAGNIAAFSSRGPTADGRIKPNTVAKGVAAVVAADWGDVVTGNGTSFSSPITAGAVACLIQAHPGTDVMEIIHSVEESASQAATPDTIKGFGIPNFCYANLLVGISQQEQPVRINVYPNPGNEDLRVEFISRNAGNATIRLYDITGRIVFAERRSVTCSANAFDLIMPRDLPAGIYAMEIKADDNTFKTKIIRTN